MLAAMQMLDAQATREALPMAPLIQALRAMFSAGCVVPPRHVHTVADAAGQAAGSVLLMPAWRVGGRLGIKTVNVFAGNAARGLPALHGVYTLFDANTGVPLAQLEGSELTTRRTVAASALAASYLAREDARTLLVVGAGRLAEQLPEAMRVVRPSLARVLVWARNSPAAAALAQQLAAQGFDAQASTSLEAAVPQADIVSCATMATTPLVQGAWLREGTHLDLMGAFTPTMCEADAVAVQRARVCIDTEEALSKAGELVQATAAGCFSPGDLRATLAQLCRAETLVRRSARDITLFKSVGTALEDLAAAELAFDLHTSRHRDRSS